MMRREISTGCINDNNAKAKEEMTEEVTEKLAMEQQPINVMPVTAGNR